MFSFLLIAGAIACSMPETNYCGTNELTPIDIQKLIADDKEDYHRLYINSDKIMYFDGKPFFELEHHPMPKGR